MTTTTEFPTYLELQSDIEDEMGLTVSANSFVDQTEMIHYCNRAIDKAEQIVHTIYEDYYLARDTLTLPNNGSEEMDPPTDIYAMKIRSMIYYNGSDIYEIKRSRDWKKFIGYRMDQQYGSTTDDYYWFPINETGGAWKMLFTPTPGAGTVERWYLRQANRIVNTSDVMDIPEGKDFVLSYMRYRVILKDKRGNDASGEVAAAKEDMMQEQRDLVNTLGTLAPDTHNDIEMDLTHYEEHT